MRKIILVLLHLAFATTVIAQETKLRVRISVVDQQGDVLASPSELSCEGSRCHSTVTFDIDGIPRKYTALAGLEEGQALVAFEPIYDRDGKAVFLHQNRFHPLIVPIGPEGHGSVTSYLTFVERPEPARSVINPVFRMGPTVVRVRINISGAPFGPLKRPDRDL